jgi:hypothetical protein
MFWILDKLSLRGQVSNPRPLCVILTPRYIFIFDRINEIINRRLIPNFVMLLMVLLFRPSLLGQQLDIEWNGSEEELIRLIEGGSTICHRGADRWCT